MKTTSCRPSTSRVANGSGTAYAKFPHPASRYAVIGVAAALSVEAGACTSATVVVGGLAPAPVRAASVERALTGQPLTEAAMTNASTVVEEDLGDDLLGDAFASAEYRRAVAHVYVARALAAAEARAH